MPDITSSEPPCGIGAPLITYTSSPFSPDDEFVTILTSAVIAAELVLARVHPITIAVVEEGTV